MFVHNNAARELFQHKYQDSYKIIKGTYKHFTVQKNSKIDMVAIDRLNPASVENNHTREDRNINETNFDTTKKNDKWLHCRKSHQIYKQNLVGNHHFQDTVQILCQSSDIENYIM